MSLAASALKEFAIGLMFTVLFRRPVASWSAEWMHSCFFAQLFVYVLKMAYRYAYNRSNYSLQPLIYIFRA